MLAPCPAKNISGDVFVSFIVDEASRLLDVEVVKRVGYGLNEEALRLVGLMPWWTPAHVAGKPVRVPATLRIRFGMQAQEQASCAQHGAFAECRAQVEARNKTLVELQEKI